MPEQLRPILDWALANRSDPPHAKQAKKLYKQLVARWNQLSQAQKRVKRAVFLAEARRVRSAINEAPKASGLSGAATQILNEMKLVSWFFKHATLRQKQKFMSLLSCETRPL